MRAVYLILALAMIGMGNAQAAEPEKVDIKQNVINRRNARTLQAESKIKEFESSIEAIEKNMGETRLELVALEKKQAADKKAGNLVDENALKDIKKKLDKFESQIRAETKKLNKAKADFKSIDAERAPAKVNEDESNKIEEELAALRNKYETGDMLEKFVDAKIKGLDATDQLLILQEAYDATRIGAYMREKTEKLAKAMCTDQQAFCQNVANGTGLDGMFYKSDGTPSRKRGDFEKEEETH